MLENQCGVWPAPLAASLYLPTLCGRVHCPDARELDGLPLGQALSRVEEAHRAMEQRGGVEGSGWAFIPFLQVLLSQRQLGRATS